MTQIYRVDVGAYKSKDHTNIESARKTAYMYIKQNIHNRLGSYHSHVYTIIHKPNNTVDGVTEGFAYNFGTDILWKTRRDAPSYNLKADGTLGTKFQFNNNVYIMGISEGDRQPWKYILTKTSQAECRRYLIKAIPQRTDAKGVIYKTEGSRIEKALPVDLGTYITHNAKWCETILWDPEYKSWRSWSPSDNDIISLINPDGTIKKVRGPLQYLKIPALDTIVSWQDGHIAVSYANSMTFYFTKSGKCVEIWDVHTGEEYIVRGKELEDDLKGYYKGAYEKKILPSLKKFMTKIKNQK